MCALVRRWLVDDGEFSRVDSILSVMVLKCLLPMTTGW